LAQIVKIVESLIEHRKRKFVLRVGIKEILRNKKTHYNTRYKQFGDLT
jgi:hypothetical protein